jgi:hypothetical protein
MLLKFRPMKKEGAKASQWGYSVWFYDILIQDIWVIDFAANIWGGRVYISVSVDFRFYLTGGEGVNGLSPQVKRSEREADHSIQSRAEVQKAPSATSPDTRGRLYSYTDTEEIFVTFSQQANCTDWEISAIGEAMPTISGRGPCVVGATNPNCL